MKKFAQKIAVITGAGSGMGRELAIQLAQAKCDLALSDINQDNLQETQRLCQAKGVKVLIHTCDMAKLNQVQLFREAVKAEFGRVDLLINNAGVAFRGEVKHTSYQDYEWMMGVNFWGVVYGTKEFMTLMETSEDAHVVNVSSVFGLMALPTQSAYNASKFAVRGFTESLYQEVKGTNINVSCVYPGGIKTSIVDNSRSSENSDVSEAMQAAQQKEFVKALKTTPQEAARVILQGVKQNRLRILIGSDAQKIDRLVRLLPNFYTKVVAYTVKFSERRLAGS